MDLKSVFSSITNRFNSQSNKAEIHLAVKISTTSVTATVWSVEGGKVIIGKVGFASIKEETGWEDFLKTVDAAISQTLKDNDSDAQKVIFAVPTDWVTDGKIHPEHLKSLRRLCKELDLSAVGYVVLTEALENFFKEVEGAPLTGILIGIDGDRTSLSMYRAGKNLGSVPIGNDTNPDNFPSAVEKALKRFADAEIFPSRFILYNGKSDLGRLAEKLTAYPWTKNLPFLHFPKVETVSAEFVVKAVAVAAGMQMGGSFEADLYPEEKFEFNKKSLGENSSVVSEPLKDTMHNSKPGVEDAVEKIDENGNPIELEEVSAEDAGFFVDNPSGDLSFPMPPPIESSPAKPEPSGLIEMSNDRSQSSQRHVSISKFAKIFNQIFATLSKRPRLLGLSSLTGLLHQPSKSDGQFRASGQSRFNYLPLVIVAVVILVAISAVVFFVPRANLIVALETKPFNHSLEVVVAAQKEASASAKSIPGSFIETTEVGTKKGVSTGSKLVGQKAKGSVTIYGTLAKTFAAGTAITSPDGLRFTLDRDVNVASGDAATPSTVSVPITAGDIGDKYNLSSATKFTIGGLSASQYLAKNDANFAGGSSHQATVVTKADQDRLLAALATELNDKAKVNLANKIPEGTTLLAQAVTSQTTKKAFSKEIDSEADTFSVDLTISFKGVVFKKSDMVNLFLATFPSDTPPNYQLEPEPDISVAGTKFDKSSNPILETQLNGKLLPKTNIDKLKDKLAGKSKNAVLKELSTIPGFISIQKETKPRFLNFVTDIALPWQTKNLSVEIVAQ